MKAIYKFILIFLFPFTMSAQQQWKFHIAFEDATGARDTVWMVYDTTAHTSTPVDFTLGEGHYNFDYTKFNVFFYNTQNDSTKVFALPYTLFPYHGMGIYAFNYQLPLILRWDTSLFHAPYLPFAQGFFNSNVLRNDYFSFVNNDMDLHAFNMLIEDSCIAPSFSWGSQDHFPVHLSLSYDPTLNVNKPSLNLFNIFPTLSNSEIYIQGDLKNYFIEIFGSNF